MKLRSCKIANVQMEGSSGSGECVTSDASAGLSKRKRQRSNVDVCSPGERKLELGGGVVRDVKIFEEATGECSSKGNYKKKKLSCRGQGSGKGKEKAELHTSGVMQAAEVGGE